jgi:hypothetical protein
VVASAREKAPKGNRVLTGENGENEEEAEAVDEDDKV